MLFFPADSCMLELYVITVVRNQRTKGIRTSGAMSQNDFRGFGTG